MWRDILITVLSIVVSLALLIGMGQYAKACEAEDVCAKRQDAYIKCLASHGRRTCYSFKHIMRDACKS